MWNVPDGSDIRARHIGSSSVAMLWTSVRTPTTKSRFTFAPRGVTTYDGLRSPPPETSFVESLYSRANTRHAISRIIAAPLACHNRWTNPCAFLHSSLSLPPAPRSPGPEAGRGPRPCSGPRGGPCPSGGSGGSLQLLEHRAGLLLDVHLQDLRLVDDHHQPVVVARHVPAGLDRLGDKGVRELVPDDLLGHRLLRRRDALLDGLVEEALRELLPEHGRERAGAVVEDGLHAEVREAGDLAVDPAHALPEDPLALRAPIDQAGALLEIDQDPAHGDVDPAAPLREVLDPHPRGQSELVHRRGGAGRAASPPPPPPR